MCRIGNPFNPCKTSLARNQLPRGPPPPFSLAGASNQLRIERGTTMAEITEKQKVAARKISKGLKGIPNGRIGIFLKLIALAIESGINPFAPSKTAMKGKSK